VLRERRGRTSGESGKMRDARPTEADFVLVCTIRFLRGNDDAGQVKKGGIFVCGFHAPKANTFHTIAQG
jgi:hypothetical protein